ENQRRPVDVPAPGRATLGGALAANASGPRRYGFGTLRDYVIGISTVNDEGHEVKAGGRVVKNVAGYDLCKLHIGSLGTLGVITKVTLKLKPRPQAQALVAVACRQEALERLLDQVHRSRTRPVCIEALNQPFAAALNQRLANALPDCPWVLIAGYEDNMEAVHWQVEQLLEELAAAQCYKMTDETAAGVWKEMTERRV